MKCRPLLTLVALFFQSVVLLQAFGVPPTETEGTVSRMLYVAAPGVRDLTEFGGHGLLVFDIDHEHKFIKRIPTGGLSQEGKPLNVKGICAAPHSGKIYISTIRSLMCLDLVSEKLLWEREYDGGCDRMAISPDESHIYLPSLEQDHWHVVNSLNGDILAKVVPKSGAHNTLYGPAGEFVYLAGLKSPFLNVASASDHKVAKQIGPFGAEIRPFTINHTETRCYCNVNQLLGFEIGDLQTGKVLHRVEVSGFRPGPVKRHGCPSHGIALTPDETEVWLTDAHNQRLHIFDNSSDPPRQVASIALRDEPGWITFGIRGDFAYPSTGEVIDTASRNIVGLLVDEVGRQVQSEKMLEVHFQHGKPTVASNQFGVGRK